MTGPHPGCAPNAEALISLILLRGSDMAGAAGGDGAAVAAAEATEEVEDDRSAIYINCCSVLFFYSSIGKYRRR